MDSKFINLENIFSAPLLTAPWNHKIIDNFFKEEAFLEINKAASHLSYLVQDNKTTPVHIDEAIQKGISQTASKIILDTADLILENLTEIVGQSALNSFKPGSYFIMPKFGITGKDFNYPIHDESLFKIINLVVYLQPETNRGTRLYSKNDPDSLFKEIEWKPNRAALFFPGKNKTWHNWTNHESGETRITLNFFVERIQGLKNTLYKEGEQIDALESLLWFYEKMGQGRLVKEIQPKQDILNIVSRGQLNGNLK